MTTVELVRPLAQQAADAHGVELWDVEFLREGPDWVLRISIDSPDGIDINTCEAVSRMLDPMLDQADPIQQSYMLEVSSAGAERALRGDDDYQRFIGSYVEVRLYAAEDGSKEHLGHLTGFDGDTVELDGAKTIKRSNMAGIRLRLKA